MAGAVSEPEPVRTGAYISWPQAAFIGVAAMVGAGIFSLLGAAGEVAGSAVWLSFVLAGIIAVTRQRKRRRTDDCCPPASPEHHRTDHGTA